MSSALDWLPGSDKITLASLCLAEVEDVHHGSLRIEGLDGQVERIFYCITHRLHDL